MIRESLKQDFIQFQKDAFASKGFQDVIDSWVPIELEGTKFKVTFTYGYNSNVFVIMGSETNRVLRIPAKIEKDEIILKLEKLQNAVDEIIVHQIMYQ